MFRQNGGTGYVLKPDYLLHKDMKRAPPCRIRVNLISGQSFPKVKDFSGVIFSLLSIILNLFFMFASFT